MREAEIQADIVEFLRAVGWFVTVTSQDKATRGQLAGLPDLIAIKHDRVLFIECKSAEGRLKPSQERFAFNLAPHLGANIAYLVTKRLEDVERVASPHIEWVK